MRKPNLKVPFGETKDGRLLTPEEAEQGLACGCYCPSCDVKLVANKPKVNKRDYFSHFEAKECTGGFESALHKMGKQIIMDAGWATFPARSVEITSDIDRTTVKQGFVDFPPHRAELFDIVPETQVDRWRPDLIARLKTGDRVLIEIKVTHKVEEAKAGALDNLMEIDLWGLQFEDVRDIERLKQLVLKSAKRHWYRCSLYDDLPRVHQAQKALDSDAAKLRAERLARQKREEAHEQGRLDYADSIEKALAMLDQGRQKAMHSKMQAKALNVIHSTCHRLRELGHCGEGELPFGIGKRLEGDWIVRTHYSLWQMSILEQFIINRRIGSTFTVSQVTKAIEDQFGYIPWMKELADLKRSRGQYDTPSTADKVWFLNLEENKAIQSPTAVMIRYLKLLAKPPYNYLSEIKKGSTFAVKQNQPRIQHQKMQAKLAEVEQKTAFNRAERVIERAQAIEAAEAERAQFAKQEETRWHGNLEAARKLWELGVKDAVLCSYCHRLFGETSMDTCPVCQNLKLQPVMLDDPYLASYPSRLRSMAQKLVSETSE